MAPCDHSTNEPENPSVLMTVELTWLENYALTKLAEEWWPEHVPNVTFTAERLLTYALGHIDKLNPVVFAFGKWCRAEGLKAGEVLVAQQANIARHFKKGNKQP